VNVEVVCRLEDGEEKQPAAGVLGDYFVVVTKQWNWQVSTVMAKHLEACLDADPRSKWVKFVDLTGSRIRVRADTIVTIAQSTAEQRAADRALSRLARQEQKADRNWEENE
jgi:hypothetical protein